MRAVSSLAILALVVPAFGIAHAPAAEQALEAQTAKVRYEHRTAALDFGVF